MRGESCSARVEFKLGVQCVLLMLNIICNSLVMTEIQAVSRELWRHSEVLLLIQELVSASEIDVQ